MKIELLTNWMVRGKWYPKGSVVENVTSHMAEYAVARGIAKVVGGEEKPEAEEKPKAEEKPETAKKSKVGAKPKAEEKLKTAAKPKGADKPKSDPLS